VGHYWGRLDYEEALRQLAAAQELRPNDADLVFAVAAVRRRQGKWDAAAASFTRAVELDPVSSIAHFNLGETYFLLHDYGRARQGIDKALELAPDWPQPYVFKAQALLGAGATRQELDRVLQAGVERVGLPAMAETFNGTWPSGNLAANAVFLLTGNPEYRRPLEQLALRASGDSAAYYQLKAHLYRQERREELARAYLDSVRALLEAKAAERPEESSYHARLGLVYAYLGRKADAIREGELAVSQLPVSREAYRGANHLAVLALIDALTGRSDAAVKKLERLLAIPSSVSKPLLRLDPVWAPLRKHPRFRQLVEGAP